MLTSPSHELVTGSIRLNDADVPVKTVKIPTAPTAITEGKPAKWLISGGRYLWERSVTILTVDNEQQYRPQESPAKRYITDCGRCRRYFTVLIKYIFPYCDSLPTTANCDDIDPYACTPQASADGEKQCL